MTRNILILFSLVLLPACLGGGGGDGGGGTCTGDGVKEPLPGPALPACP